MSLTAWVLFALLAGLAAGVGVSVSQNSSLLVLAAAVEPIGALWVNAIRMTVIPLVVSLLITGIASNTAGGVGKIGGRALAWFVGFVASGALVAAVVAPPLLSLVEFDTSAITALSEPTAGSEAELPPVRDWIVGLIPSNPVKAAADGAMLPLIVFSTIFALAIARVETRYRQSLIDFFQAIAKATFVLVEWILAVAPVGVFFLVLPLAARTGIELVGAMGLYLVIVCGLLVVALVALYPAATVLGGISLRRFARACAPAQAVAFSTRSSLASLPAMLDSAERDLRLPGRVSGIVLPVAVSLFKYGSPIARMTGTFFVAQLFGIDLGAWEIAAIAGAVALLAFYSPGIPSGGLFIMTPIYIALNLPVEGIGILIALDLIPDMFITPTNVTADMAVAVVLARQEGWKEESAEAQDPTH